MQILKWAVATSSLSCWPELAAIIKINKKLFKIDFYVI